jgi:hypothetical protein
LTRFSSQSACASIVTEVDPSCVPRRGSIGMEHSIAGRWLCVADGWTYEAVAKASTGSFVARSRVHLPISEVQELISADEVERVERQARELCERAMEFVPSLAS